MRLIGAKFRIPSWCSAHLRANVFACETSSWPPFYLPTPPMPPTSRFRRPNLRRWSREKHSLTPLAAQHTAPKNTSMIAGCDGRFLTAIVRTANGTSQTARSASFTRKSERHSAGNSTYIAAGSWRGSKTIRWQPSSTRPAARTNLSCVSAPELVCKTGLAN